MLHLPPQTAIPAAEAPTSAPAAPAPQIPNTLVVRGPGCDEFVDLADLGIDMALDMATGLE